MMNIQFLESLALSKALIITTRKYIFCIYIYFFQFYFHSSKSPRYGRASGRGTTLKHLKNSITLAKIDIIKVTSLSPHTGLT